jgi:hypothetical protein
LLTYTCKKCSYEFSQADKAWGHAVLYRVCPKCNNALNDFHVSHADSLVIEEKFEYAHKKRLDELEQLKVFAFALCSFLFLFMLFSGQLVELLNEPQGFKIILLGIAGIIFGFNAFRRLFSKK